MANGNEKLYNAHINYDDAITATLASRLFVTIQGYATFNAGAASAENLNADQVELLNEQARGWKLDSKLVVYPVVVEDK
jgi:hypothetical protein